MIADYNEPKPPDKTHVNIRCRVCDATTSHFRHVIVKEIDRLRISNFQMLECNSCHHKFDIHDFTNALNNGTVSDWEQDKSQNPMNDIDFSKLDGSDNHVTSQDELQAREKEEALKIEEYKQEQIKLLQSGKPYDKSVVGDVPMEEGTPGDRRCVRVLKAEADLYAYTAMCIIFAGASLYAIYKLITNFINKFIEYVINLIMNLNWCIICSVGRICSFVGSAVLIPYALYCSYIGVGIFGYESSDIFQIHSCNVGCILIMIGILVVQTFWIIDSPGKWAKFISKRISNKFKKEGQ